MCRIRMHRATARVIKGIVELKLARTYWKMMPIPVMTRFMA